MRTLSISQIETADKKANHEFPDKIVFCLEGGGGGQEEGCFAHKSFYWLDFEISIFFASTDLPIAVKFLRERKRRINFNLSFATFWLHYICEFACLWLCLTENFLLDWLSQTTTPETTFPTLFSWKDNCCHGWKLWMSQLSSELRLTVTCHIWSYV